MDDSSLLSREKFLKIKISSDLKHFYHQLKKNMWEGGGVISRYKTARGPFNTSPLEEGIKEVLTLGTRNLEMRYFPKMTEEAG